ncbi:MAG TPA: Abi family protein [Verrucomicrobiae bacterium]|jgi:abortive infection bacteriophage resistance protein
MGKIAYTKPSFSHDQHLELLKKRGLIIANPALVIHYLNFIGYYRLSGYALPFQIPDKDLSTSPHTFRPGTTFEMILDLYIFDRELRLTVMDAIERIEVAVRASISNSMCQKYGPHWFVDKARFHPRFDHNEFLAELRDELKLDSNGELPKTKDVFLRHYFEKYNHPEHPPSWMVSEILTFGKWSILYQSIRPREDQAAIADTFNLHYKIFSSWLHSITYLRNLCAHHSRLWNRHFAIPPAIMNDYRTHMDPNDRFCAQAAMLHILMQKISPESKWPKRLHTLMESHPSVPIKSMSFKENWQNDPFWI